MFTIHYGAIILAALVNFVIGFLFHGPLFGKVWMKLAKITPTGKEKFKDMIPQMLKNFGVNLVYAFVLSFFIPMGVPFIIALITVVFIWLGFIVTSSSMDVIWMGKSWKLWLFEAGCSLVSLVAMTLVFVFL